MTYTFQEFDLALEESREQFEIQAARRFYQKIKLEKYHVSEEEEQTMPIRRYMVWDPVQKFYCPSIHDTRLRDLDKDWEAWKEAFKLGWNALSEALER